MIDVQNLVRPWPDDEGAERARALFADVFGGEPAGVWAAPGRVNLIGEHLDYNGGLCLPIAIPHRTFAALRPRGDAVVRVVSGIDSGKPWVGTVADLLPGRLSGWPAYALGPAWALRDAGHRLGGFDLALDTCVPLGSGLSSSAAVGCSAALALAETFGVELGEEVAARSRLAALCVRAENEVAGSPTGGLDQAAVLGCRPGHALLLDFAGGPAEQVAFDPGSFGLALTVIDTRVEHSNVDGAYGRRRAACVTAAERLGVATLREVTDLDAALEVLGHSEQRSCVRHVATEMDRVSRLVALVRSGRLSEIGPLLDASHASLRDDYRVSCDELDVAVDAARGAGALGARMTGGGFGGSAMALIAREHVPSLAAAVTRAFERRGWRSPRIMLAPPSGGASRIARPTHCEASQV